MRYVPIKFLRDVEDDFPFEVDYASLILAVLRQPDQKSEGQPQGSQQTVAGVAYSNAEQMELPADIMRKVKRATKSAREIFRAELGKPRESSRPAPAPDYSGIYVELTNEEHSVLMREIRGFKFALRHEFLSEFFTDLRDAPKTDPRLSKNLSSSIAPSEIRADIPDVNREA